MFDLEDFISRYVTKRKESLFEDDVKKSGKILYDRICGKSILVIGGAGSIGSAFIKEVLAYNPSALVIVDVNENALAEITRDLRSNPDFVLPDDYVTYPMDYSSPIFRQMYISRGGFDVVANFSAHKHVRSEKDIYSVKVLLQNNIVNAKYLLDLLETYPPERFFCVSTDKAANPVNIMGASKRILEDLIFSYSDKFVVNTARFANVAFSNGSLPDGFLKRIEKKQPLCAPMDVKRYFVSPKESGQICMMACFLGENRNVFFPKLAENSMLSFDKIAEALLIEQGYKILYCKSEKEAKEQATVLQGDKEECYPVFFSESNTTGEKAYEEFFTENELVDWNYYYSLGYIKNIPIPSKEKVFALVDELKNVINEENKDKEHIIEILNNYLDNFRHEEKGFYLDSKM